jgi:hypothetical protein
MSVKETKEVLVGLLKVSGVLAESFKDGVQTEDFVVMFEKIMKDEPLKQALMDLYNGIDQVPTELSGMSFTEGMELLTSAIPEVISIVKKIQS